MSADLEPKAEVSVGSQALIDLLRLLDGRKTRREDAVQAIREYADFCERSRDWRPCIDADKTDDGDAVFTIL